MSRLGPRVLVTLATAAVVATGGPAATAGAQVGAQRFGPAVLGSLDLGVAADGEAVVAWAGDQTLQTSVRAPGGPFRPRQSLGGTDTVARAFDLAMGSAGDAAIAWRRADRRDTSFGPLLVSVRRPGRNAPFAAPLALPGSAGGTGKPAVGVAPAGRIVVAWTAPGAPGCGDLVRATVLTPGRAPRAATRISGTCAHAGPVQAVMSHDGTGAVVWRGGATATARRVEVVPVGRTRFGTLRRLGTRPVGADIAVSPARAGALVLWRQTKDASTSPATTYLLAADVTTAGATRPDIFAPAGRIVGVPRVSARRDGSALVTWEEGLPEARVLAADRVPYPTIAFGPPQVVDPCGAVDASRTYATPVLPDGGAAAAIVFQSACMARFGLGLDFGIALSRRPADATWQDPQALSQGEYGADARIGASDDGELVLAWLESGVNGGVRVTVVRR